MPNVIVNFNAPLAHDQGAFGGPLPDELLRQFWSCGGEPALSPYDPVHLSSFWMYPHLVNEHTHHKLVIWIMHDAAGSWMRVRLTAGRGPCKLAELWLKKIGHSVSSKQGWDRVSVTGCFLYDQV